MRVVYQARPCTSSPKNREVDKCGVALFSPYGIIPAMDTRQAGRLGAIKTNEILTPEGRSKAAKKGWKNRKKRLKDAE